jgi:HK97 family phage major capsid protein
LITVNKEVSQPAATITWINILDMAARMLPEDFESAEWDVTLDALREVMTMALAVGTGGSAVMAVDASQAGPRTLFSRPIRWTRKTPGLLGTKGDISLVNWGNYVIGDTQAMALESSIHEKFSSDRTTFRNILRGDGQPGMLSALTPENNGPTLSAYVQLETRS